VVQSPLRAGLVAGIGPAAGLPSSLTTTILAAVDLAAVTAAADIEDLTAEAAGPLAQGLFDVRHDARPGWTRDGLDSGTRSCQTGVTSSRKPTFEGPGIQEKDPGPLFF
jgi:hypothetical protein